MSTTTHLPKIMVAPNGAHKTKADHPALPMTIAETVATAKACFKAGAQALHAHVRDDTGRHVLDAGLYTELLSEMKNAVPDMAVQITTEAVGRYTPDQQRALVRAVQPKFVSIALKEMVPDNNTKEAASFYAWAQEAQISVQHIVYEAKEITRLANLVATDVIPTDGLTLLFVLGRYSHAQQSEPSDLNPFIEALEKSELQTDWACCAFGHQETNCLLHALNSGGKARIGFENSLFNSDGSIAQNNAERVRELTSLI
ncbi:3-keto-5-aminohexanoate cleavage protein [Pseudahrensia aquimaris]|uniref:3-keto-5-aminohexanoate cleavage protein n=1 Tax=Pseudahrensia aquimaris TaxID=744461 RepID=A0ABW3FEN6_9HYPH